MALEVRVKAVNALGASAWSQVARVARANCPEIFKPPPAQRAATAAQHSKRRTTTAASARHYSRHRLAEDGDDELLSRPPSSSSKDAARAPELEAELEALAAQLGFAVSLEVVHCALLETRASAAKAKAKAHAKAGKPKKRREQRTAAPGAANPVKRATTAHAALVEADQPYAKPKRRKHPAADTIPLARATANASQLTPAQRALAASMQTTRANAKRPGLTASHSMHRRSATAQTLKPLADRPTLSPIR